MQIRACPSLLYSELGKSKSLPQMRTAAARPEPPRQLEVADADAGHLLLRWAPGCDDGGAPILGYRVQVMPSKPHASLELYKPAGDRGSSDADDGDADEGHGRWLCSFVEHVN
eukprot:s1202_g3.t1